MRKNKVVNRKLSTVFENCHYPYRVLTLYQRQSYNIFHLISNINKNKIVVFN